MNLVQSSSSLPVTWSWLSPLALSWSGWHSKVWHRSRGMFSRGEKNLLDMIVTGDRVWESPGWHQCDIETGFGSITSGITCFWLAKIPLIPFFQRGWNRIATSRCRIPKQQLFTSNNQFSNRTSKREDGGLDKHPNMGSWHRRRNLGKGKGIKSANGQIRMDQTYPTARRWISSWQLDSILQYCTAKGMCQGDGQTNGSCLVEVDGWVMDPRQWMDTPKRRKKDVFNPFPALWVTSPQSPRIPLKIISRTCSINIPGGVQEERSLLPTRKSSLNKPGSGWGDFKCSHTKPPKLN